LTERCIFAYIFSNSGAFRPKARSFTTEHPVSIHEKQTTFLIGGFSFRGSMDTPRPDEQGIFAKAVRPLRIHDIAGGTIARIMAGPE
jgi:hypothetical protein